MGNEKMSSLAIPSKVKVKDSSSVLCIRKARHRGSNLLKLDDLTQGGKYKLPPGLEYYFPDKRGEELRFRNNFEILVVQNEVVNYLKSTKEKFVTRRYAGEYNFPGGSVDEGETVREAGERELREELNYERHMQRAKVKLHPFTVNQTRPIRSISNLMHVFVAFEEENKWLSEYDTKRSNNYLRRKKKYFLKRVKKEYLSTDEETETDNTYFNLSLEEKEKYSPEIKRVAWMPVRDFVYHCFTSLVGLHNLDLPTIYVDKWQEKEYKRYRKNRRRDPLALSAFFILNIERNFRTLEELKLRYCLKADLGRLAVRNKYLFDGMTRRCY